MKRMPRHAPPARGPDRSPPKARIASTLASLSALTLLLAACSSSSHAPAATPGTPHNDGRATLTATAPSLPTPPPVVSLPPGLSEEQALAALRARPMWLPALNAGAACPTSKSRPLPSPYVAPAFGDGPLYLLAASEGDAVLTVDERRAAKAIWQLAPGNEGPLLLRGRELSGRATITFDDARTADLVFPRGGAARGSGAEAGWQDRPSLMHLPVDGCYAIQVDGPDFTWLIVFEVRFSSMYR